jgi:hypothetical protein
MTGQDILFVGLASEFFRFLPLSSQGSLSSKPGMHIQAQVVYMVRYKMFAL